MRIKLTLTYDGANYCGWQVQKNGVSVQAVLKSAVYDLTGENLSVTGSGRTDAGVHAQGQVAHFEVEKENIPPEKFAKALNARLPSDIRVIKSERVSENFHACKSAVRKTYCYTFYKSQVELPLKERYAVRIDESVDTEKMREVAKAFIGEHDFKGFCASGSAVKTTVRTIYNIDISETDGDLKIFVTGNGFLYNMVRMLSGALLLAGEGKLTKAQAEETLKKCERVLGAKTCPAKGLCLLSVEYDEK